MSRRLTQWLCLVVLAAFGFAVSASVDAHALEPLAATSIPDPVFEGQVMVYHGGLEDGPTVLLVHGLGTEAASSWRRLVPELVEDYRVIAVDLPGFGASSAGNRAYTPDRYVGVLAHVLRRYADGPVNVVGHSMGGAVALRLAGRYPDRVASLHLVSVAGILHRAAYSAYLSRTVSNQGQDSDSPPGNMVDRALGKAIRKLIRLSPSPDFVLSNGMARHYLLGGEPGTIAAFGLVTTDFSRTLERIRVPARLYWGSTDPTAPTRVARILGERLPNGHLTLFDGVGHVPMIGTAERFNSALLAGLQGRTTEPDARIHAPAEAGDRVGRCRDESGRHFTGAYDRLVIESCENVELAGVRARQVVIRGSRVSMTGSVIIAPSGADEPALRAEGSQIYLTAGEIRGPVAIEAVGSSLDIAGTRLHGGQAILRNSGDRSSEVIFSVVPFQSGERHGHLHLTRAIEGGTSF